MNNPYFILHQEFRRAGADGLLSADQAELSRLDLEERMAWMGRWLHLAANIGGDDPEDPDET